MKKVRGSYEPPKFFLQIIEFEECIATGSVRMQGIGATDENSPQFENYKFTTGDNSDSQSSDYQWN